MGISLVVKDGLIVDGTGRPPRHGDVGVADGRIVEVGTVTDSATEVIDASDLVVAPGFIDVHTHLDAQVFWDPYASCSCYHGVTTVVMGNCGFTLAPCHADDHDRVFRNLERAEDIAPQVLRAGVTWDWETYPDYLHAIERTPKGVNFGGMIGHSALRTYVMGERAYEAAATDDDLDRMAAELRAALTSGAFGFSTTFSDTHMTSDDRLVPSRVGGWVEAEHLVRATADLKSIFQLAGERPHEDALHRLALETGVAVTFGMFASRAAPGVSRTRLDRMRETVAAGGRMFAEVNSEPSGLLLSFQTQMFFDHHERWEELRQLPLADQARAIRDPAQRALLIEAALRPPDRVRRTGEPTSPEWEHIYVLTTMDEPSISIADEARSRGVTPIDALLDIALEHDLDVFFFQTFVNEDKDEVLDLIRHPQSIVSFTDSGAHVSQLINAAMHSQLFQHWVRDRGALSLEEAVKLVTSDIAHSFGIADRGLLLPGAAADLVLFDPQSFRPKMPELAYDLPGGGHRLRQESEGLAMAIVNGEVTLRDNKPTGKLPGAVIRPVGTGAR